MSSSAGVTVPGRRQLYLSKQALSSIKDKPKSQAISTSKRSRIKSSSSKPNGSGEELHNSREKSRNFSYVFTGAREEKPWSGTHSQPKLTSAQKKDKNNAQNKESDAEKRNHHIYTIKEGGKKKTETGTMVVSDKYFEAVKDERTRLLDLLNSLKKRNEILETENSEIVKKFDALQRENMKLRQKKDTGGEPVCESYKRIYDDRMSLREAENSYKTRILKLEQDLKKCRRNYEVVTEELKSLKDKAVRKADELELKGKYNKNYWDSYHLRAENAFLKSNVQTLTEKLQSMSVAIQKSPRTAPFAIGAQIKSIKPVNLAPSSLNPAPPSSLPNDRFGQTVKYVTLPEIVERQHNEMKHER